MLNPYLETFPGRLKWSLSLPTNHYITRTMLLPQTYPMMLKFYLLYYLLLYMWIVLIQMKNPLESKVWGHGKFLPPIHTKTQF